MINIRKQAGAIGTAAALILGGSATAWALSNASPRTPITNQQGAEASASTTVQVDEPAPSATPSAATTTAEPAASSTAPATPSPTPTASTTKASTPVTTPSPTPPATTPSPRPTSTDPAYAGQYNGGHGTADNGPYPSRGPGDPNAPTGLPNKEANTPPSPKPAPTPATPLPSSSAQD